MNWLRTTILLAALTGLFLAMGYLLGGESGMIFAFLLALVMNGGAYWFSDKLVLKIYKAQPVDPKQAPELYQIIKGLSQRAGIPMPRVYIIDSDTPNAFATGRNPSHSAIAVTTGIMRSLTTEELTGVLAHELSHVKHHDTLISVIAATIAGAISMIANLAQMAALSGRGQDSGGGQSAIGGLVMLLLAPMAAALIQLAVSRSREFGADEGGAEITHHPMWLASALRKIEMANRANPMPTANNFPTTAHLFIVNPLNRTAFMNLFSTHPPIEERIRRLENMGRGR